MAHSFTWVTGCPITVYIEAPLGRNTNPIIVEHQVLDATHSTLQYLGAKSPTRDFRFKVYGSYWMDYIETKCASGSGFFYTDDRASVEWYYVPTTLSSDRLQALNYTDNWYQCSIKATFLTNSGSLFYDGSVVPVPPPPR
jgi:hypothetical protein